MKLYLGIPRERGWPGDHDVALGDTGHLWPRWSMIHLGAYHIGATPWQLIYIAGWQIAKRTRLYARRCYQLAIYNTYRKWTTP